jgi:hypothetical protein
MPWSQMVVLVGLSLCLCGCWDVFGRDYARSTTPDFRSVIDLTEGDEPTPSLFQFDSGKP